MSGDEGMAVSTQRGESFYNVYVYPIITLHILEFYQFYVKKGRKKEKEAVLEEARVQDETDYCKYQGLGAGWVEATEWAFQRVQKTEVWTSHTEEGLN